MKTAVARCLITQVTDLYQQEVQNSSQSIIIISVITETTES